MNVLKFEINRFVKIIYQSQRSDKQRLYSDEG